MRRGERAQLSIEYLSAYAWMFLGLFIVIAVLFYFDVFSAEKYLDDSCTTGDQIRCLDAFVDENEVVILNIVNNLEQEILVTNLTVRDQEVVLINFPVYISGHAGKKKLSFNITSMEYGEQDKVKLDILITYHTTIGGADHNTSGTLIATVQQQNAIAFIPNICGDGWQSGNEECDGSDKVGCGDDAYNCNATCYCEYCGDLIINGPEYCEQGDISANPSYKGALSSNSSLNYSCKPGECTWEYCGDRFFNANFEECDPSSNTYISPYNAIPFVNLFFGNYFYYNLYICAAPNDFTSAPKNLGCVLPVCGDGFLQAQGDPTNFANPDYRMNISNNVIYGIEECDTTIVDGSVEVSGSSCFKCHLLSCGDGYWTDAATWSAEFGYAGTYDEVCDGSVFDYFSPENMSDIAWLDYTNGCEEAPFYHPSQNYLHYSCNSCAGCDKYNDGVFQFDREYCDELPVFDFWNVISLETQCLQTLQANYSLLPGFHDSEIYEFTFQLDMNHSEKPISFHGCDEGFCEFNGDGVLQLGESGEPECDRGSARYGAQIGSYETIPVHFFLDQDVSRCDPSPLGPDYYCQPEGTCGTYDDNIFNPLYEECDAGQKHLDNNLTYVQCTNTFPGLQWDAFHTCDMGICHYCGDGIAEFIYGEECDGEDYCSKETCKIKRSSFVTSTTYFGDLTSYADGLVDPSSGEPLDAESNIFLIADAICYAHASAMLAQPTPSVLLEKGGYWVALISTQETAARDRLAGVQSASPIFTTEQYTGDLNQLVFASDFGHIFADGSGAIEHPLSFTEEGIELDITEDAWTGSNHLLDMQKDINCKSWASSESSETGIDGSTSSTDKSWADNDKERCSSENHLYCAWIKQETFDYTGLE
ncbi:MAG: hypothetical protein H6502_05345 [Candidatus Woesearchaeota archaeon]|nr:MAG: hypothetical protein H6502_05345 [Candidatus Woesearchaeota archaeon]